MENKYKLNFLKQFKNKKVLVTGHTGFKGSWLTLWLVLLGAKVMGLSVNVPSNPSHFKAIKLKNKIKHKKADVRNLKLLKVFCESLLSLHCKFRVDSNFLTF